MSRKKRTHLRGTRGQAFADRLRGIPLERILCVSLDIHKYFHVVMLQVVEPNLKRRCRMMDQTHKDDAERSEGCLSPWADSGQHDVSLPTATTGPRACQLSSPLLKLALKETLGVIVFQEQVIKVARDLAGFVPGEVERLRRTPANKRAGEEIERFHEQFLKGVTERGWSQAIAERAFEQFCAFGGYAFPKSHAEAPRLLVKSSVCCPLLQFNCQRYTSRRLVVHFLSQYR